MSFAEAYLLLFVDSFVSNLVFSTSDEIIFNTMKVFDTYNNYIILAVVSSAYFLAIIINYFFGVVCYTLLMTTVSADKTGKDRIIAVKENKYLPLIIFLSFVNFYGKFIILFMGFCRVNIYLVISLALTSRILSYLYLIWF